MSTFNIKKFQQLDKQRLKEVLELEHQIFEKPLSEETLIKELQSKQHPLILIGYQENKACGYKIGFERSSHSYYSWIGGVVPSARQQGLATQLMIEQHQLVKELGYQYVRTHTKNKYKAMLILNLKSGFDIIGVYQSLNEQQPGIILEKEL